MAYIHALPTEIRTKLHKGKGENALQRERTSGAGIVERQRNRQTLEANEGDDWAMSTGQSKPENYVRNPEK